MADAQLEAVRDKLMALAVDDVESPDVPMPVALQEANDLLTVLQDGEVWGRLLAVGAKQAEREALAVAVGAARAAQSAWTVQRDRMKSEAQSQREARGFKLRADMLAAGRWNLRGDRTALGTLSAIAEGEGVADLIQDLNDLAELFERKSAAFVSDATLDLAARMEEARSLSSELSAGTSNERLDTNQAQAVDLRNRAYTHLAELVSALREAGRYAFRDHEEVRKRFSSRYLQRKGRRRTAAAQAETPSA